MYPIKCYGQFLKLVFTTHPVNLTSDTVKVALLSSSYTPDQDAHTTFNDVATYEISGEGYTTGGIELTNKQVQYDPDNNQVVFTANSASWTNATFTARYAVIYVDKGTQATDKPLIAYVDFQGEKSCENSEFTLEWPNGAIFAITTP